MNVVTQPISRLVPDGKDRSGVQVTYVEPYQESYEARHKRPHFERHYNLRKFIYATPFTTGPPSFPFQPVGQGGDG